MLKKKNKMMKIKWELSIWQLTACRGIKYSVVLINFAKKKSVTQRRARSGASRQNISSFLFPRVKFKLIIVWSAGIHKMYRLQCRPYTLYNNLFKINAQANKQLKISTCSFALQFLLCYAQPFLQRHSYQVGCGSSTVKYHDV